MVYIDGPILSARFLSSSSEFKQFIIFDAYVMRIQGKFNKIKKKLEKIHTNTIKR